MNTDQASVDKIMLEIDYDKNGVVDFDEFIVLMVKTMVSVDRTEEELVSVFKRFDKDNDDQINKTDLLLTFEELGYENVKLEDTQYMIELFDRNDDGLLDFQEFVQLLMYDTQDQVLFDLIGAE